MKEPNSWITKNVIKKAVKLYDKRAFIVNAFVNNHVYHGD